jgi:hypothetical protein
MEKFTYTLTITAKEKADAIEKLKALTILAGKLSVRELKKLAHVVQNDPVKTAMAKAYLGV